jgi:hypothetical protein
MEDIKIFVQLHDAAYSNFNTHQMLSQQAMSTPLRQGDTFAQFQQRRANSSQAHRLNNMNQLNLSTDALTQHDLFKQVDAQWKQLTTEQQHLAIATNPHITWRYHTVNQ